MQPRQSHNKQKRKCCGHLNTEGENELLSSEGEKYCDGKAWFNNQDESGKQWK